MDSPPIAANLSKSTWDPRWLWSGRVTVYLILPSTKLSTLSPLMRLWIGVIFLGRWVGFTSTGHLSPTPDINLDNIFQ